MIEQCGLVAANIAARAAAEPEVAQVTADAIVAAWRAVQARSIHS